MTRPNSDDDPTPVKSEKKHKSMHKLRPKRSSLSKKRRRFQRRHYSEGENERKTRKKMKKKVSSSEIDEAARLQRRTRYLLIKMKLDQNLIDAYSAEGWKGQRTRDILYVQYHLKSFKVGKGTSKSQEAIYQILVREKIRPEKELQRAKKQILECKLGIRDVVRQLDLLSSTGSIEHSLMNPDGSIHHEHIFCAKCKSTEAFPDNDIILCDGTCNSAFHQKCLDPPLETENIPPEDQNWLCRYCECRAEILETLNAHLGTHFSMSNSWEDIFEEEASILEGGNDTLNQDDEWPSDDSEDIDYNPEKKEHSGAAETDNNVTASEDEDEWSSYCYGLSDESSNAEIMCGRRQRRSIDYVKLHDEMFGKDAEPYEQMMSEDEDWGPTKTKKRKANDAAQTLMTLHETNKNNSDNENEEDDSKTELPLNSQARKSFFRIPGSAVKRLREVFAENELPSRDVKESVSKELGLDPEKVSKWFKNARYLALKTRKSTVQVEKENEAPAAVKKDGDDVILMSENCRLETVVQKKPNQRNQTNSWNMASHKTVEDSTELSEDDTMKNLLKERVKEKKKMVEVNNGCREAGADMERLCRVKGRVENMKQRLMRFQNGKAKQKPEECVIYVPVAELYEKP